MADFDGQLQFWVQGTVRCKRSCSTVPSRMLSGLDGRCLHCEFTRFNVPWKAVAVSGEKTDRPFA